MRSRSVTIWITLVFGICLLGLDVSQVHASLTEVDSPIYGPASLTRDTATGLEWLDLTQTVNLSFNQVSAELGKGGDFEGFRYATLDEIRNLWLSATITDLSGSFSPVNVAGVSLLVSLMGETNSLNGTLPGEGLGHIGLTPRDAFVANRSFLELSLAQTTARASLDEYTTQVDFVLPNRIGHYLVVPTPTAFILGSIGLSLAGWKLRRREGS